MNKFVEFKSSVKGKKIDVCGIGVSNIPLIKLLCENGAVVTAHDKRDAEKLAAEMKELEKYNISYVLGNNYLDNLNGEIVFKSPGIRIDAPGLLNAAENGSIITSEMEVFFDVCPAKIIGITGSDGKTTTTTLISEILKKSGKKVWIGGNIGHPLLADTDKISNDDIVVVELSSFQLHTMKKCPSVAVVTNLSPNHLDMHKGMQEYIDAKKNIFINQNPDDRLVLNADNEITAGFEDEAKGSQIFFSKNPDSKSGVYLKDGAIYYNSTYVLDIKDIAIPGIHNVENYMAAIAALWGMVSIEDIVWTAKNFNGVEHRIEFVRELNGVKYYNDSIASSPTRTIAGLNSFDKKVILIAGGYDKKISFDELGHIIKDKVEHLVLVGHTARLIKNAAENAGMKDITVCNDFKEAVMCAKELSQNGDIVLLSPACASFDLFKNFAERGNTFKKLVMEL